MVIVYPTTLLYSSIKRKPRYGFYIDEVLKYNIDNYLLKGVKQGHDAICLITGLEGTGKSTFAQALAYYCDPTFPYDASRIVFSGQDLMNRIDNAKIGQAIIFDEAIMDMSSQDFATDMQKILIKKFTLIRKKRLIIYLVIPSIFMLRRYFAIFRTRFMINCYCPDGIKRGYFRFFSFSSKKKLYLSGYKEMDMGAARPEFRGRFTDTYGYIIDGEAYERKKDYAIKELTEEKNTKEVQLKLDFDENKVKLKAEVDIFKENWRKRFEELKTKFNFELQKIKESYSTKFQEVKTKSIDLQKSGDKKKIRQLNSEYNKLLCFFFEQEKKKYFLDNNGEDLSISTFRSMLISNNVCSQSYTNFKNNLEVGKELVKLENQK